MDAATRGLLISVQVCFGVFPWLGKVAMRSFEPRAVLVWRLLVGAAVLGFLAWRRHGRAALPAPRDLAAIFCLSLLGVTINQWLFLEGLSRSTAVNAGLLMTTIPVATTALGVALGRERVHPRKLAGIGLAVGGVAFLFLTRGAAVGGDTLLGDVLLVVNAISYSAYLVLAKPVLARLPQPVVVAWVFGFGALLAPALAWDARWWPDAAPGHWLALAGVLLFPTILAYLGNIIVLSRTSASTTAAYVLLQPFIAAGLGIALLGERPDGWLAVAAVAVVAGLWLVSTRGNRRALA